MKKMLLLATVGAFTFASIPSLADGTEEATQSQEEIEREAVLIEINRARAELDEAAEVLAELEADRLKLHVAPLVERVRPHMNNLKAHFIELTGGNDGRKGFAGIHLDESPNGDGVLIAGVVEDSPAEAAGLLENDKIISLNGLRITDSDDPTRNVIRIIGGTDPGEEVRVGIIRGDQNLEKIVTVADPAVISYSVNPSNVREYSVHNFFSPRQHQQNQLALIEVESDLGYFFDIEYGVVALRVPDESELRIGDVLLSIDGKPVRSISHATRYLTRSDGKNSVIVKRRNKEVEVEVDGEDIWIQPILND